MHRYYAYPYVHCNENRTNPFLIIYDTIRPEDRLSFGNTIPTAIQSDEEDNEFLSLASVSSEDSGTTPIS